jgi:hypothetical protein
LQQLRLASEVLDTNLLNKHVDPAYDRLPISDQQRQADLGGATVAARRRHGLEVENEGLLKDLVVIFIFLKMFCTIRCFF